MYNLKQIFAKNIKRLRLNKKLSQEKFAEAIGLQWKSIANFESGRCLASSKNLQNICDRLNISPVELFLNTSQNKSNIDKIKDIEILINEMEPQMLDIAYKIIFILAEKPKKNE